jgi:excisionase family DNA binding protein
LWGNAEDRVTQKHGEGRDAMTGLPGKATYRVSEVAGYFDVTERTVYLWIEHGHLEVEFTPMGQKRITKESLDNCRFNHVKEKKE